MTTWFGQRLNVVETALAAALVVAIAVAIHYSMEFARYAGGRHDGGLLERTLVYAHKRAAQERLAAERRETVPRQDGAPRTEPADRYRDCVTNAARAHDDAWATACKRIAELVAVDRADCLAKPKLPLGYCEAAYRLRDSSQHCVLPVATAADLDVRLTRARNNCHREAALH